MRRLYLIILTVFCVLNTSTGSAQSEAEKFQSFMAQIKQEAQQQGVSPKTLHKYLDPIPVPPSMLHTPQLKLEKHQAQKELTFEQYFQRLVPKSKLEYALKMQHIHRVLLQRVEKSYGVPAGIIIALWGAESNFGRYQGKYPLVQSLAYIAFARDRKSKYFHSQLLYALKMLDRPKVIPQQLKSSFDGGMGQTQFMPGTYLYFAVDFDRNGLADIWTSPADVFASIANFIKENNWHPNERWGWLVQVPHNFPSFLSDVKKRHPVSYWRRYGVKLANGNPLPEIKGNSSIIMPAGRNGPAYLVTNNFYVLMRWNNIVYESLTVTLLADILAKQSRPQAAHPMHQQKVPINSNPLKHHPKMPSGKITHSTRQQAQAKSTAATHPATRQSQAKSHQSIHHKKPTTHPHIVPHPSLQKSNQRSTHHQHHTKPKSAKSKFSTQPSSKIPPPTSVKLSPQTLSMPDSSSLKKSAMSFHKRFPQAI